MLSELNLKVIKYLKGAGRCLCCCTLSGFDLFVICPFLQIIKPVANTAVRNPNEPRPLPSQAPVDETFCREAKIPGRCILGG